MPRAARGRAVTGGGCCLQPVVAGVFWVGCARPIRSVSFRMRTIVVVVGVCLLSVRPPMLLGWAIGGELR